jgi:DNA-binding transcriptional MerR regulator
VNARNEIKIALPAIPAKRYFTIGEVSELCGVKPHVLRYWEQEFTQLKPMKRRGNRRYYQHHEVLLVRRIRELLYEHGFTISGARNRLSELQARGSRNPLAAPLPDGMAAPVEALPFPGELAASGHIGTGEIEVTAIREELERALAILSGRAYEAVT